MVKMKHLIAALFVASASFSYAADTTPSSSASSWQAEAQKEIKAKNYDGAIKTLLAANEPNSADWNNLLGYAQRKKSPPDLNAAERYYQAALKIDPKHKGALEYYGELFLMKNDLPGYFLVRGIPGSKRGNCKVQGQKAKVSTICSLCSLI